MRFDPYGRFEPTWTARKLASAERRLKQEREAFPLFADDIAAMQPTIEAIRDKRLMLANKTMADQRQQLAINWRNVRVKVLAIPAPDRLMLLAYWKKSPYPGKPFYLGYVVKKYATEGLAAFELPSACAATG